MQGLEVSGAVKVPEVFSFGFNFTTVGKKN